MSRALFKYNLLYEVFLIGLRNRIIGIGEVKALADKIVMTEDEPAYSVIEICMARDVNEIISAIYLNLSKETSPIPVRVLFGLIFKRLSAKEITLEEAVDKVCSVSGRDALTEYEWGMINEMEIELEMQFDDMLVPDATSIKEKMTFLKMYRYFNLENYEDWSEINRQVELLIIETEASDSDMTLTNNRYLDKKVTTVNRQPVEVYAFIAVLILLGVTLIVLHNVQKDASLVNFTNGAFNFFFVTLSFAPYI